MERRRERERERESARARRADSHAFVFKTEGKREKIGQKKKEERRKKKERQQGTHLRRAEPEVQDALAAQRLRVGAQVAQQLQPLRAEPLVLREKHVVAGGGHRLSILNKVFCNGRFDGFTIAKY